jgi:hypothetical protein
MTRLQRGWIGVAAMVFAAWSIGAGAAETWSKVSLVDTMCSLKVKADPDKHTRACALQCAKGGFGVFTADGTYLKLDDKGNDQAVALLKGAKGSENLRVNVTGTRNGETIAVSSIQLAN